MLHVVRFDVPQKLLGACMLQRESMCVCVVFVCACVCMCVRAFVYKDVYVRACVCVCVNTFARVRV